MPDRPQKMRDSRLRGLLGYCVDYRCSHSIAINGRRGLSAEPAASAP